ncbi:MAG: hypothetical protein K0R51_2198 [Cytophagaceae bacterium]|jgi:hypothetical protein|nr:hypothetical protein [Cytophagaceae bacterium]
MKQFLVALCLATCVSTLSFAQTSDFQYLGSYDAQGLPAYLVPVSDLIATDLLSDIDKALPERQPVPAVHPEYIQATNETDIKLYKEASVWVTLVNEVAGYTNAFGFYTYPLSNPPRNAGEIQKHTIVFPNVSLNGSGGALSSGNKVLLGKFPANTGIGWFIVADAFKEGRVTAGKYTLYSEPAFNPEPDAALKSHTVLFNDAKRNKVILGFEDMRRDQGSDQDFNDLLFYITADPYNAIKTDNLLNLDGSPAGAATVINNNTVNNNTTNNNTVNVSNTAVNTTNANANSNNNNGNTTTIVNNTTIINNNHGNNNSNTNNASGTSGNRNTANTGQTSGNNGNAGNTQGNGQNNGNNNNSGASQPAFASCSRNGMPSVNFENLRSTIKAQRVESNKPTVIKQAVSSYYVTVSQVKEMLRLISVEQYRLDMAKFLYDRTCDQANYFEVNALLNAGRVRDLEEYLKKKRGNGQPSNGQMYNQQNSSSRNEQSGNRPSRSCVHGSMSEQDFDDLQSVVRSTSFSDSKQNVIKEAVPGHCISAVQVKQLMSLFSFEADKLSVAKYLYPYTSDQQNYFKVNDMFSFSTSVDELKKYIRGED